MSLCAFIGDELTGAGFRLAGAEVHTPDADSADSLFRRVRDSCELLIVTAESAELIAAELLEQTIEQGRPLLLIIADAAGRRQPPDIEADIRRQLGMSE